jgi:hydrogenase-4 component E
MTSPVDILLALVFLSVMFSMTSHRLLALIRLMAVQGLLVSLVPFLLERQEGMALLNLVLVAVMISVKAVAIPAILWVAMRRIQIRREIEPIVGYHLSIFIGLGIILASVFISSTLHLEDFHALLLPAAFTTLSAGLFLLMARRKAITQIIGYLMLENGIYLAGSALARQTQTQHLVELGILLDLLVGVMVMGIILYQINHSFDDADTSFLETLKD